MTTTVWCHRCAEVPILRPLTCVSNIKGWGMARFTPRYTKGLGVEIYIWVWTIFIVCFWFCNLVGSSTSVQVMFDIFVCEGVLLINYLWGVSALRNGSFFFIKYIHVFFIYFKLFVFVSDYSNYNYFVVWNIGYSMYSENSICGKINILLYVFGQMIV